jgi:hypothetical protein
MRYLLCHTYIPHTYTSECKLTSHWQSSKCRQKCMVPSTIWCEPFYSFFLSLLSNFQNKFFKTEKKGNWMFSSLFQKTNIQTSLTIRYKRNGIAYHNISNTGCRTFPWTPSFSLSLCENSADSNKLCEC